MNEKQLLLERLRAVESADWAAAAIAALSSPEMAFAGSSGESPKVPASHLLRVYLRRQAQLARIGRNMIGLENFLLSLSRLRPDSLVSGQPFVGGGHAVGAFYDPSGKLIGCITRPRTKKTENMRT